MIAKKKKRKATDPIIRALNRHPQLYIIVQCFDGFIKLRKITPTTCYYRFIEQEDAWRDSCFIKGYIDINSKAIVQRMRAYDKQVGNKVLRVTNENGKVLRGVK